MPYILAGTSYPHKPAVKAECRRILAKTSPGAYTTTHTETAFLLELFASHTEWEEKSGRRVTSMISGQNNRCFAIQRDDGTIVDISFNHAVSCLGMETPPDTTLTDFKMAARTVIKTQIRAFRETIGAIDATKTQIDHVHPMTFDRLLWMFCWEATVNPYKTATTRNGTITDFADQAIADRWAKYHKAYARLRAITPEENQKQPCTTSDWDVFRVWL